MKQLLSVAIAVSLLSGCVSAIKTESELNWQPDHEQIKSNVAARLKDPLSVQWGEIWNRYVFYQDTQRIYVSAVCGSRNGKNSFGGYAGFKKFVFFYDGTLYTEGQDPAKYMADTFCSYEQRVKSDEAKKAINK